MDMTVLDTIIELQRKATLEFEDMVLAIGPKQLKELEAITKPSDWFPIPPGNPIGERKMVMGIQVICVPDYDGVEMFSKQRIREFGGHSGYS